MGQAAAVQQQAACCHKCVNIKYGHDRHAGSYVRFEGSSAQQCVLQQQCAALMQLRARGCARRAGARASASSCPSAKNATQSICGKNGKQQSAGAAQRGSLAYQLDRVSLDHYQSAALVSAGAVTSYASHKPCGRRMVASAVKCSFPRV